mgnify:CR=1 FL=1
MAAAMRELRKGLALQVAGKEITGNVEYYPDAKSLVIFHNDGWDALLLTVPRDEAGDAADALDPDQVLLRNWTEHRGIGEQLAAQGLLELTGDEVKVGMFRLQALVARVL